MKKLLSLPPNLVPYFHEIENVPVDEWFCTSDPEGKRLGSGGGTTWLLEACRKNEKTDLPLSEWLSKEKRLLLHAGGQSRRLPAYAPSGKILTPIPVFRWARGQKLNQNLLSLQLPLYEKIMEKAPESLHTLIASGDVYLRANEPLQPVPEADVVCYGLWVDPILATRHGVFFSSRKQPGVLDYMLQKPSLEELGELAQTHLFLMDIGIWLLSDKAVELLMKRSYEDDGKELKMYDLYGDFGLSLGVNPRIRDNEINELSVAVLPLPGGEFYHYGTNKELISSTLAVQNLVRDQRAIMQRKVKPHPAMFVQNAEIEIKLTSANSELWVENSFIGSKWTIESRHILTGIPENDWELHLPAGMCLDVIPIEEDLWAGRLYSFDLSPEEANSYDEPLYPLCNSLDDLGKALQSMITPQPPKGGAKDSISSLAPPLGGWGVGRGMGCCGLISASEITRRANLKRLVDQRKAFGIKNWPLLAANHEKSVFYQLNLADAAVAFAGNSIPLPDPLPNSVPLMKQIHDQMFRARVLQLEGGAHIPQREQAFSLLREGLISSLTNKEQTPHLDVYPDQIVWGRSPVRIDLAGGWTDTPPYCLYAGGNVVNIAIELNGQPPLQVYVKPAKEYKIILRSIDLGAIETLSTYEELRNYNKVGSPFSIPKAALSLAGFLPQYATKEHKSLENKLKDFGSGIELTLLSAVPAGSGLGTSSILAATVLGALSDFCGLGWDKNEIGNRTLILEQLLTTGGGWQDQFGGVLHGLKLLQTDEGLNQSPVVRWLPEHLFTDPAYKSCHLLYYTGITRIAKDILSEIVCSMFLNSGKHLQLLAEMKTHAMDMYDAIQYGDFDTYGRLIKKTWEQKKAIDAGTNPPAVEAIISKIKDYTLGYKLPGAGGGGYLYMVAKDPEAAAHIQRLLTASEKHPNARFVDMQISHEGLQVSRS